MKCILDETQGFLLGSGVHHHQLMSNIKLNKKLSPFCSLGDLDKNSCVIVFLDPLFERLKSYCFLHFKLEVKRGIVYLQ